MTATEDLVEELREEIRDLREENERLHEVNNELTQHLSGRYEPSEPYSR